MQLILPVHYNTTVNNTFWLTVELSYHSDYNTYLISYYLSKLIMWHYFCFRPYHDALVLYLNYHYLMILVHLSITFDFPTVKLTMVTVYPADPLNYQLNTVCDVVDENNNIISNAKTLFLFHT